MRTEIFPSSLHRWAICTFILRLPVRALNKERRDLAQV